jgi:hypothetical protein
MDIGNYSAQFCVVATQSREITMLTNLLDCWTLLRIESEALRQQINEIFTCIGDEILQTHDLNWFELQVIRIFVFGFGPEILLSKLYYTG